MIKKFISSLLMLITFSAGMNAGADQQNVFKQEVKLPMQQVYPVVYKTLEDAGFYVVFEPFISESIQRFADKWGEDYNRNKLDGFRSMVFCNGWYANQVSNADPDMLALCPLRLGLYEKAGVTSMVFARPTVIAGHSKAKAILQQIEDEVIAAIKLSAKNLGKK